MESNHKLPITFWIIAIVGLVWNAMGVFNYFIQTFISDAALASLPEEQQSLLNATPAWINIVFAIAVFGGFLGCLALLLKKAWAIPLFLISLIAIVVQMGYSTFMTDASKVYSVFMAVVMPIIVIAIGLFLWYYAKSSERKGWIN